MFDYHNFEDTFDFDPDYTYDDSLREQIDSNRKTIESLFVDKVLKLLGVQRRESQVSLYDVSSTKLSLKLPKYTLQNPIPTCDHCMNLLWTEMRLITPSSPCCTIYFWIVMQTQGG